MALNNGSLVILIVTIGSNIRHTLSVLAYFSFPTVIRIVIPTVNPTVILTVIPTIIPTVIPTVILTIIPTDIPTFIPTVNPLGAFENIEI